MANISITTNPTKTTYIAGQSFDPTGMVVTAEWSDGTEEVVADYTYSPEVLSADDTEVVVSYGGKTASVSVTVNAIGLEVEAATDTDGDLFGKVASDLQENVVVGENVITGTLNYVNDYTGFSSNVAEQSGNYLALKCTAISGATITVEVVGGTSGPVTLESDGLIVDRIASTSQSIRVIATIDGQSETKTFALTDVVLGE